MIRLAAAALAVAVSLASGPAAAQTLGQGPDADIPWIRLGSALLLCLGLAVGAAFALRRRLNGGGGAVPDLAAAVGRLLAARIGPDARPRAARLTDIETRRVSTQVTVSVFKCDGHDFLIAASAQGQLTLVSLEPSTPEPGA